MSPESDTDQNKQLIASGVSNGETILVPDSKKTAEVFMILFHELGHNIDKQFDIREILKPLSQIKSETITLSAKEAGWLLTESESGWKTEGIFESHRSIIRKILKAILVDGKEVKSKMISMSREEFNTSVSNSTIVGSEQDEESGDLKIMDQKVHRNSEVPADFVMELMFDVFNRSINKHFSLAEGTTTLKVVPDERNIRSTNIARYLFKKNWKPPGFYLQLPPEQK